MDVRKDVPFYYHDIKGKCGSIVRICLPALISFFCICLFLLLSFAIIERYSISEVMREVRELVIYNVADN